jgi:exodeoxyribonuclease V beta subunit
MRELNSLDLDLHGTTLIEASAGTGKTYTLTTLYLRLLVERDLLPSEILVVTYTQAATSELRERVRGRIQEAIAAGQADEAEGFSDEARMIGLRAREESERSGRPNVLRRALREFDEAAIFTIHGFCQRALAQNAFESGVAFDAELIEAADVLEQTLAQDLWACGLLDEDPDFVEWLIEGDGKRWGFEPGKLKRELLDVLGADEEMHVEPEPLVEETDAASLGRIAGDLEAAWAGWADTWKAGRDRVEEWLLASKDLNRQKYNPKTVETKWLPQLAAWSEAVTAGATDAVPRDLPSWWQKLTTQGLAAGMKKDCTPLVDPIFDAFGSVFEAAERRLEAYSRRALALRQDFVEQARERARRRREERHEWLFDDLLSELRAALRPPAGERLIEELRRQYRVALIDEFQDTDPVQYEIFRRIWHRDRKATKSDVDAALILIGDPKQAIYSFRGADLFTYLSAGADAAGSVHGLAVNYRSDPGTIDAVNAIFDRPDNAFGIADLEFHPVAPQPEASTGLDSAARSTAGMRVLLASYERFATESGIAQVSESDEDPEATANKKKKKKKAPPRELPLRVGRTQLMNALAKDIVELLESDAAIDGRPVEPSDIAILCRKKVELDRARRALEALGVPCVDRGNADVFETREAWELLCVLRAMLRSGNERLLRAALATGAIGWNANRLAELEDESQELAEISERYADYARIWRQSGFMRAIEAWRRQEGVTPRLLSYIDGERRLTNWLHLVELLQRVASERVPSPTGLADWLERAIADEDVRHTFGSEASLLRLESDEQAVSLVTLHRSKGLEYEIVYLPCLWEDASSRGPSESKADQDLGQKPPIRCHDPERKERILDLGGARYAEHLARQKEEERSESMRLLYVGLTRAKRQCVVMWGAIGRGTYASTPFAWLVASPHLGPSTKPGNAVASAIRTWSDADWREAFEALAAECGPHALAIETADWSERGRWQPSRAEARPLDFDRSPRPIPAARVTTSFSGLTRGAHRAFGASISPESIGRDMDTEVVDRADVDPVEAADLDGEMDAFPRGADAGTLLHEVLESIDFSSIGDPLDEEIVRPLAIAALERHAFPLEHADQILHVVRSVADTPLRETPRRLRLRDVSAGQLRPEMEFTLGAAGDGGSGGLTPDRLSTALRKAEAGSPLERYAERAERLSWRELHGYLRGFIDAVFFDGARYYLVDYKSNHLGGRQVDYSPENLVGPMIDHDYVLQYLIYTVALDRHLSTTLSGYSYAEHFGGAYYLFLRGMSPGHVAGSGIFFDRPDITCVHEVSNLLGSDGRAGA